MFVSGQKALTDARVWLRGPPGCSGVVEMPSQISGSGRKALLDVRELSGVYLGRSEGQPGGLGMARTISRMSLSGERPFHMSGSCWVAFPDVREALPFVREWSGGPPGCLEVVGKSSQIPVCGWETLPGVREWSRGRLECPRVVVMHSLMSRSG